MAVQLVSWFEPVDQTLEEMLLMLHDKLETQGEDTYLSLAVEDDTVKGMTIAYKAGDEVFIWQATASKGVSSAIVDEAFDNIKQWARDKGCKRISGVPNRAKRIWQRRWGFKQSDRHENEVILEI